MLTLLARAKINLSLDILYKRDDGYHEIESIMQSIETHDVLRIAPADTVKLRQRMTSNAVGPWLPQDARNDVLKVALLMRERYNVQQGALLQLQKFIPVQAGLGGGSADAAATLVGLNILWGLGLDVSELEVLAAEIGSDTAFLIRGGTALSKGRGEKLQDLPKLEPRWLTLFKPASGLSTPRVFQNLDLASLPAPSSRELISWLEQNHALKKPLPPLTNHLKDSALSLLDELAVFGAVLQEKGFEWQLSGSGSTIFVFADSKQEALYLKSLAPSNWWKMTTRTATTGVKLLHAKNIPGRIQYER